MTHDISTKDKGALAGSLASITPSHVVIKKTLVAIDKYDMLQAKSGNLVSCCDEVLNHSSSIQQSKQPNEAVANQNDSFQFPIVLMVSGGSDSTALCLLVHELSQMGLVDLTQITVLHVNHGLRGADADNDALFVQRLANLCSFLAEVRHIDIDSCLDKFDGNVENAGRFLRYELADELLNSLCAKAGVEAQNGRIWVAHTQDDRVETFFMRSIVGTGPGGLASIRYTNGRVARPILNTTRDELRDYIKSRISKLGWQLDKPSVAQVNGGLWREDSTNYATDGFRTFVRHKLVPMAKQKNPNLGNTLARTMDLIQDEDDMVQDAVEQIKSSAFSIMGEQRQEGKHKQTIKEDISHLAKLSESSLSIKYALDINQVQDLQSPLLRRLIYSICKDILPYQKRIEQRHIDLIVGSMHQPNFALDLPGGARVFREYDSLIFEADSHEDKVNVQYSEHGAQFSELGKDNDIFLQVPGSVQIDEHTKISIFQVDCQDKDNISFAKTQAGKTDKVAFVDKENLLATCDQQNTLIITHRYDGDIVYPLGMGGKKKKLSDIFVDKKIPRAKRDTVLIVRAGNSIVWVVGVLSDDRFKVRNNKPMLCLQIEEI